MGTNPGILISGHDLRDLQMLLEQTEGTGVDVYTHSEMLPAHYYPAFKKFSHFKGNYGNAWWKQKEEFDTFNGPILLTTNCLVGKRTGSKIDTVLASTLAPNPTQKLRPRLSQMVQVWMMVVRDWMGWMKTTQMVVTLTIRAGRTTSTN